MILYIDTAFDETILAVKKDEKIFVEKISKNINISQTLIEKTRYIFDKIGKEKQDIEVIGFNNGPGNFTSLRVALAYIKAISYYLKIPVVPLNSFQVLALSIVKPDHNSNTIIAVDARMNEIYWARYKNYSEISARIVLKFPSEVVQEIAPDITPKINPETAPKIVTETESVHKTVLNRLSHVI